MNERADNQDEEMEWLKKADGISFVKGWPSTESVKRCREIMLTASKDILTEDMDIDDVFQYGDSMGHAEFREQLAKFLSQEYGDTVSSKDLQITAGATHGLHFIVSLLCDKSAPIFIEDPSYFYGFRLLRDDLQMNLVPVPGDETGINIDVMDRLLTAYRSEVKTNPSSHRFWAAAYLMSVFGNPTGWTYSQDRCKEIVQLARKHNILLIMEDVYNLIHFGEGDHPPPRLLSFDKKSDPDYGIGHVISNGSFSKFLAPGVRVGWIEGSSYLIDVLTNSHVANSGGSFNHYTSKLLAQVLETGILHKDLPWLCAGYKKKMEILCQILDEHLPKECSYTPPKGGFFLWVVFPEEVDSFELVKFASKNYGVFYLPGVSTSVSRQYRNCARLCISCLSETDLKEAAIRLCQAYKAFMANPSK